MKTPKHPPKQQRKPMTKQELDARKQQILTRQTPSVVSSIADAVVTKDEDLYFLCDQGGNVPTEPGHGFGLYYQDTRFLSGYTLSLAAHRAQSLAAANRGGFKAVFQLTNPELRMHGGGEIEAESIGVTWSRMLRGEKRCMYDLLTFENYGLGSVRFPVAFEFRADFEPVFTIRGLVDDHPGQSHPPCWQDDRTLCFRYDGADEVTRRVSAHFSSSPSSAEGTQATFWIALGPRERRELMVAIEVSETPTGEPAAPHAHAFPALAQVERWLNDRSDTWMQDQTTLRSNSLLLNRIIDRSLRDLHTLRSELDGKPFFAAGIPWFATLFGRDSLITAMQTLAFNPRLAEGTLRLLAEYQGSEVDEWRDEQPGKILHELRVGELATIKAIPHDPYYGSIDATPLFLILIGQHARWTGRLDLFHALRDHVERALGWIDRDGDTDGDGYVDYMSGSDRGLINQGWKDSGNAIVNRDGSLATPPIAVVEVQGYVYLAKREMASLFERAGEGDRARRLRHEAEALKKRFNRDFWLAGDQFFALALQQGGRPVEVVSSNPGQALWSGIVDEEKAARLERRLMAPDMFSGWGIRTLSSGVRRYNPNSYHLGSVWPHDNSLIASGLRRYGFDSAAMRIFRGLFEAATHFDQYRMPELFTGFSSEAYPEPVRYPVACHPQAWAAGSLPFLITTLLGLEPDGFQHRLMVVRPQLPEFVTWLELHGMQVGDGRISLRFHQAGGHVTVEKLHGDIALEVEGEHRA